MKTKVSTEPRWTYSTYRAALKLDGKIVALVTPDGRNSFGDGQIQPILDSLNQNPNGTDLFKKLISKS